jgi:Uma2 family endonuclease
MLQGLQRLAAGDYFFYFYSMGASVKILPHYTYDEYCKWEGKWELIEGIPYAMSPAPILKHQRIANGLGGEFHSQLKKKACKKCTASQFVDYKIAEDTIVQPDVLLYCGSFKKAFLDYTPKLVAEILSPSTALKDRHTKFHLYEKAGVPYLLLINPETEIVQLFLLEDGEYILKQEGHDFTYRFDLDGGCSAEIDFNEIW